MSSSAKVWRLVAVLMTGLTAVLIVIGIFFFFNTQSDEASSESVFLEPTSFEDIDTSEPYFEYLGEGGEVFRSQNGADFFDEQGEQFIVSGEEKGRYEYFDESGAVAYQSQYGLLYSNADSSEPFVLGQNGEFLPAMALSGDEFSSDGGDRSSPVLNATTPGIKIEEAGENYRDQEERLSLSRDPQTFLRISGLNDFDFGDVDGDGDLDVAIGRFLRANQLYLNENGVYVLAWSADDYATKATSTVEWGDIDGDGDLDLAVGATNGANLVYLNENGRLGDVPIWSDAINDITNDLKWADMNGDGFLDLVVANGLNTPNRIYLNDKNGSLEKTAVWSGNEAVDTLVVDLGFFDSDEALDMALAIQQGGNGDGVIILQNKLSVGEGMIPVSQGGVTPVISVAWGDMGGDERSELAVADASAGNDSLFQNRGDQLVEIWTPENSFTALDVAWGDVNGDGYLDLALAVGANGRERIYLNNRSGSLEKEPAWRSDGFSNARKLEWVDIDNDRDLDLVVHYGERSAVGDELTVFINHQPPFLVKSNDVESVGKRENNFAIDLADFNQDGFVDVAIGKSGIGAAGAVNQIYLNDGGKLFAGDGQILNGDYVSQTFGVAWGDANNDGLLDLAIANGGRKNAYNLIYFAQKSGTDISLNPTPVALPHNENSQDLVWGDVDGDGI